MAIETLINTLPQIEWYRENCFSHTSAEELFAERGITMGNYDSEHISVQYVCKGDNEIELTERKLADEAICRNYKFVTNRDYCGPCIAARGWKSK